MSFTFILKTNSRMLGTLKGDESKSEYINDEMEGRKKLWRQTMCNLLTLSLPRSCPSKGKIYGLNHKINFTFSVLSFVEWKRFKGLLTNDVNSCECSWELFFPIKCHWFEYIVIQWRKVKRELKSFVWFFSLLESSISIQIKKVTRCDLKRDFQFLRRRRRWEIDEE